MPLSREYLKFISNYPTLLAIGNTPMVKLDLPMDIGNSSINVKYEHLNPGGSIKDRPVMRMLVEAILSGELTKDKTVLDATSGNAGIAYAMIGAVLGYKVTLVMPENASEERKRRIRSHGAEIIFTDPMLGYDEALYEVKRLYEKNPDKYYYRSQYDNENNPMAHYDTTAVEILEQVPNITHFVAGVGTGGTITGVGRRLKEYNNDVKIIGINPPEWPGVEGLKPLGEGHIIPKIFDETVVDEMIVVDVDKSYEMSHLMASVGLFAGQSSGAYLQGAATIARRESSGCFVTLCNDIGERYLSTGMWP